MNPRRRRQEPPSWSHQSVVLLEPLFLDALAHMLYLLDPENQVVDLSLLALAGFVTPQGNEHL